MQARVPATLWLASAGILLRRDDANAAIGVPLCLCGRQLCACPAHHYERAPHPPPPLEWKEGESVPFIAAFLLNNSRSTRPSVYLPSFSRQLQPLEMDSIVASFGGLLYVLLAAVTLGIFKTTYGQAIVVGSTFPSSISKRALFAASAAQCPKMQQTSEQYS